MADTPPKSSKPPRDKKNYLDTPYTPGDTIPAPDVVEQAGETAWEMWSEIESQHQRRFADTAPASEPMSLDTEERGWARTVPGGMLKAGKGPKGPMKPGAAAPAAPALTVEGVMLVARKNNRVCPTPQQWDAFCERMTEAAGRGGSKVREPLPAAATGAAWSVTPPLTKRLCFREQIEWAGRHGVLEQAMAYVQGLAETDWLHMGQSG